MQATERREAIAAALQGSDRPVSASALAKRFSVSRQIIVGDIAILRAAGAEISATPRGYVIDRHPSGVVKQIACRHDFAETETELNVLVDYGCTVLDVIVEHPLYGQLTGILNISSRYDVRRFLERCRLSKARPLSDLTGGIHLHTISCPGEAVWQQVCEALAQAGILLQES